MKINQRTALRNKKAIKTMGFSLNPFGRDYSSATDYAAGIDYINKFHEANDTSAKAYVDDLFLKLGHAKAISEIESLGLAIKIGGTSVFSSDVVPMSESEVQKAADALASVSSGRIPASVGAFRFALVDQATATPFADAVTSNAVVVGFQKVGDSVIQAGETVLSLADSTVKGTNILAKVISFVPFVLPIAIGYGVYKIYGGGFVKDLIKKRTGA